MYPLTKGCSAWSNGTTPDTDQLLPNNFIKTTVIEGHEIELVIWDNTGMEGYERLRRLSYQDVHVVLICFDISEPDSLDNVEHMVYLQTLHEVTCHSSQLAVERRSKYLPTRYSENPCRLQEGPPQRCTRALRAPQEFDDARVAIQGKFMPIYASLAFADIRLPTRREISWR
jgi:hypothetical protein